MSKYWCFWTVVLEKTLESPLDCKEIKPINPKGNQSWLFIGRPDAEAEASILWPPDVKNWLLGNDPDVGKDWRQEEKRTTEEDMVGRHHQQLDKHEFEQAPGVGDGQGSMACCSPQVRHKEQRVRHNWVTELNWLSEISLEKHILTSHPKLTEPEFLGRGCRIKLLALQVILKQQKVQELSIA